jgi:ribonuclease BN (tRNA processing enzyme)
MTTAQTPAVTVTFAGSGDAFGSGGRCQACIHLATTDAESGMLLDCGATSLVALARARIDPNTITTVLVSHMHVDHFGGIPALILAGQFTRRATPLTVAGPQGLTARLTEAMEVMFPGSSTVARRFPVHTIELEPTDTPATIGVATVQTWRVNHGMQGGPFLALRVDIAGRTIAYTGDTAWTNALVEVADRADLFIAEAYFWDKPVPYHLRHADLIDHRDRLTSARTILTHMSTDMLTHADEAAFDLAHDGLTIAL